MAIGAEGVLDCVWRFLHFSMRTSSLCVQKHPFVSAILLFFYVLYVFFNIFMFWFPFLVCIAVLLKLFWTSGGLTIVDLKQDENGGDFSCKKLESVHENAVVNREGLSLIKQKSRRTNVTRRINSAQSDHEEEKDWSISSTSNYNNLIGGPALIDKNKNKAKTEKKNGSFDHGESSNAKALADANIQAMVEQHHSVLDSDISDSNLLSSDESEEHLEKFDSVTDRGPAQEDGTKAVQWTDDDQKNLMDLGLSEIERNKRLESLIARRRARKFFKMQVEKGLIDLDTIIPDQIAPIFVSRNPVDFAKAAANAMDTPGSAPSILLPMQNPFDLPYDPQEEKPNLMTDSFQQEFTAVHQKDMLFCRHESFSHGSMGASTFPSDTRRKSLDGLGYSRFKKQSETGEHDKHIERMLSGKHDDVIEALLSKVRDTDSDINLDVTEKAKSSMGPREGEDRDGETPNVIDVKGTTKSVNTSEVQTEAHVTDDSNDETSSTSYSEEDDHHNNFNGRRLALGLGLGLGLPQNIGPKLRHVPPKPLSCSIPKSKTARDPLCESSPRLEERLFYAERVPCHTPTYSIASDLQVEVSEFGSPPMTIDGANSPTDRESLNLDGDFEREYMWAASSLNSRIEDCESKPREPQGLSEKDLARIRFSGNNNTKDHGVGESSSSSMHLQQQDELDDVCSLSSSIADIYGDNQAHMMSSGALSSNAAPLENQNETMKLTEKVSSNPSNETTKKSNVPTVNKTDNLKDEKKITDKEGPDPQANLDTKQSTKDNKNSNHSEGDLQKVEYEGKTEHDAKPNFTVGVSEANQISGDPVQSTEQKSIVNKDVLANSTASSSPKSVLLERKPKDQVSSSNSNDEKHTDAAKSGQEQEKVGEEAINKLNKQAEEIGNLSTKTTEAASVLKVQTEEIEKVSQKTTEAAEELKKPDEETRNVSGKATETTSELKKSAEEIGSASQKAKEVVSEIEVPADGIMNVSQKATEAAEELKKSGEEIGSASQKAKEVVSEIKVPADGIIKVSQMATEAAEELKKLSEEINNASKNVTEPMVEIKKPAEEIGSGSQQEMEDAAQLKTPVKDATEKVAKYDVEFKKPADSIEVKKSAEEIGSGSQKAKEDVVELKEPAQEVKDVSEMKKPAESMEVKKSADEIGSGSQKAKEDVVELKKPAQEVNDVSEMKKPADSMTNVTQRELTGSEKAAESAAELLKSAEEIENVSGIGTELKQPAEEKGKVWPKVTDEKDRVQSKRATEAAAELLKSAEDIGSPLLKATDDIADLKKPIEEIGAVSQQATKAGPESTAEPKKPGGIFESIFENPTEEAEMKKPKEDSVESKRPTGEIGIPIEKATELKKPAAEIENVPQKASKPVAKTDEKIENDLGKAKETAAELKRVQKSAEEPGNVAQKATDVEPETKKPNEAAAEVKKPVEVLKT